MKSKSKKGYIEIKYLLGIILMLLLLLTFLPYFSNYKNKFKEKAYSNLCNQYIELHLFSKKGVVEADLDNFPCETQEIMINASKKHDIMKEVSDGMIKCTNSYHRGEKELFGGNTTDPIRFCAACYKTSFKEKDVNISAMEFLSYQSVSKASSGEKILEIVADKNFSDNFVDKRGTNEGAKGSGTVAINTNKEYLTLFIYDKKIAPSRFERIITAVTVGAVVGTVTAIVIVASGGSAIPVVAGIFAAEAGAAAGGILGGGIAYYATHNSQDGSKWISSMRFEEFNSTNLKNLNCSVIVGIQEPGITNKPIDE